MSDELRSKKPRGGRRSLMAKPQDMSDGGGPVPGSMDALCGHSGCGHTCNVRYVGPISHVRDHHALHAARGVGHIWAASVITGFAVVLTGVLAYTVVEARSSERAEMARQENASRADITRLMNRLEQVEGLLQEAKELCRATTLGPSSLERGSEPRIVERGSRGPAGSTGE